MAAAAGPVSSPSLNSLNIGGDEAASVAAPTSRGVSGYRFNPVLDSGSTLVALITKDIEVYRQPGDERPFMTQKAVTVIGNTTVLAAVGEPVDGWVEVMLPVRPNGSTGWVRVDDVHFYVAGGHIVVDLSDRELVYYHDGVEMLRVTVAIGTARNPTPTGHFFVTDNVALRSSGGPFGPYALALSGRSNTITEFNGGDGIIGIHGTNRPETIGTAASLGCVRLRNDMMTLLHELVPIGTPVEIRG
jgi:hypothetical protein